MTSLPDGVRYACDCAHWTYSMDEWGTRLLSGPYRGALTFKRRVTCALCKCRCGPGPFVQSPKAEDVTCVGQLKMDLEE